jgi:hypothetical protein
MPRLNAGTLLENIVVLEGARLAFDELEPEQGVAFATSFAMPPFTQCWSRPNEASTPPVQSPGARRAGGSEVAPRSISSSALGSVYEQRSQD